MLPHAIEELCLALSRMEMSGPAAVIMGSGTYKDMMRYIHNGGRGKFLFPEFYAHGTCRGTVLLQTHQIDVGIILSPWLKLRCCIVQDFLHGGRYGRTSVDQTRDKGKITTSSIGRCPRPV